MENIFTSDSYYSELVRSYVHISLWIWFWFSLYAKPFIPATYCLSVCSSGIPVGINIKRAAVLTEPQMTLSCNAMLQQLECRTTTALLTSHFSLAISILLTSHTSYDPTKDCSTFTMIANSLISTINSSGNWLIWHRIGIQLRNDLEMRVTFKYIAKAFTI